MALRRDAGQLLTVFRNPAKLAVFSIADGARLASLDICGDADDLFFDAKRSRVYVSCGDGFLDVLEAEGSEYKPVAHIATVSGARTSLFVPELDRLLRRGEGGGRAAREHLGIPPDALNLNCVSCDMIKSRQISPSKQSVKLRYPLPGYAWSRRRLRLLSHSVRSTAPMRRLPIREKWKSNCSRRAACTMSPVRP